MECFSIHVERVATAIDIILIFMCIDSCFEKVSRRGKYVATILLGIVYIISVDMTDNLWLQVGCSLVVPLIYELLFYKGIFLKKLVFPFFLVVGIGIINMVTVHGVGTILRVDMNVLMQPGSNARVLMLVINKLLLLAASYIIRFWDKKHEFNKNAFFIVEMLLIGTLVSIVSDVKIAVSGDVSAKNQGYMLLSACGMVFVNVAVFAVTLRMSKQYRIEMEREILLKELANERQLVQRMDETYEKTRILQHDLKYYMSAIANLIEAKKYEQAQAEIHRLIGEGINVNTYAYTGSHILNAVINEKIAKCKTLGIRYDIRINGSVVEVNEMDVAIVLSNLIDNAIEAEEFVTDKYVLIELRNVKEMLFICIANNISHSVLKDNPEMRSSKVDSDMHGLGHLSARNIVEKLDGSIQFEEEENKFWVVVSIPNGIVCVK